MRKYFHFPLGSRTILFGGHQIFLHGLFTIIAWWKLNGVPIWQEVICCFCHDLGYWNKPELDGEDGKNHPEGGANIASKVISFIEGYTNYDWYGFCLCHSRTYAHSKGMEFSALCVADKYTAVVQPKWLILPLMVLSGEIHEFILNGLGSMNEHFADLKMYDSYHNGQNRRTWKMYSMWYDCYKSYITEWVEDNKEGGWIIQ